MKRAFACICCLVLMGCESTHLYSWGGYQDQLHRYYDKPDQRLEVIEKLESHALNLEQNGQKIPPGLFAEIGTFYFELGNELKAVEYYRKEADAWPESRAFMDLMIGNLEARQVKEEASDAS